MICAIAFVGMLRWKWNIVPVVLGSGLLGLIYTPARSISNPFATDTESYPAGFK
jgi:hypothetical protein